MVMNLTLLLDLDDTLLVNNIDDFLPKYLEAFSREVAAYIDPDRFVRMLLTGTRAMVANRRPDCTLKEVFENAFFSELGLDTGTFQALAERFYTHVFPTLREYTRPRPEAVHLVEQAWARGYRMVIATNPLFPQAAIHQRLAWAGCPVDRYPFELVASYETFHFGKPEPAYFAEVLARMGWPQGPIVMVGDDLARDIIAARRMGLPAFWLSQDGVRAPEGMEAPSACGFLEDVLPWIDQSAPEDLHPDFATPIAMVSILRATPAALDSLCRELPAEVGARRPGVDEWCVNEVLCHLRDVDQEVNLPRLQMLLKEDNPFIPGMDTDAWAIERNYLQQDGALALQKFIFARMQLIELLESIQPSDWQRMFRHAIFGPTHFFELVNIIASHDRLHIRQIRDILGALRA
jgi:HAD superfamily hydrolase (TIGR01549 family)